MLAKRIIPCLDVTAGRVVKGTNFINLKDAGDPVELGKRYDEQGADELVFLDITASSDKRYILRDLVERTASEIFIPFTVGGGINDIATIRDILKAGADKVSINTAAVKNPKLIHESSLQFGSQCIVLAIDAKEIKAPMEITSLTGSCATVSLATAAQNLMRKPESTSTLMRISEENFGLLGDKNAIVQQPVSQYSEVNIDSKSHWQVYIHGGRTPTGIDALKWAKYCEALGAGEILLTSMDRDGTKNGYDLALIQAISEAVKIPVIASGGAGTKEHILDALKIADAALLASLLHYRELTINELKNYLISNQISIRS